MKQIDPQNSPGFLVGRVAHQLKLQIRKFLAESGINITAEGLTILTAIAQLESQYSMGALAEILGRDPTTLKRQLNQLITQGLVRTGRSKKDKRVTMVTITEKGRDLVHFTMPMTLSLREHALKNFSEADRKALTLMLKKMLNNLREGSRE